MLKKLIKPYVGLRKEIYIIFISRTINAMGAFVFPFLTLLLTKKIGLTEAEAGVYIAASGILVIPSSLIGGKIVDVIGRKKVIIIFETLAIFCYGSCFMLEPGIPMAYLLILSGVFFGIAGPAHDAMVADLTTPEQRTGAYSLNYLGFNFGYAIAQLFAGYLFAHHLKLLFIIDAVTALIGVALIGLFVGETIQETAKEKKEEKRVLEKSEKGSVFRVLFSRPILIMFAVALFGYRFIYSQWSFMLPLHTAFNFGEEAGPMLYGTLGAFNAVIVVCLTPLLTALFRKKTNVKRVIYAGILFFLGFGLLGFISTYEAFFACVFIFTLGEILEATSIMPFIMNHTPSSHRGRMSSVLPLIMGFGFTAGPLVMGSVLEATSFAFAWKVSAVIVGISTIGMLGINRFERNSRVIDDGMDKALNESARGSA
ncbi:MFS transporter [Vallitalea pronyensis]|uniref:MFS transporter n=1 Tax=Vallitalea pronyensis TaxID=1348613 RepID=A0A8J8MID0_9FIRM|nr:MFS transporter [Vallitalea pronyensis]QUI22006.1 MFS transporter [Vallitalea pronyensis]